MQNMHTLSTGLPSHNQLPDGRLLLHNILYVSAQFHRLISDQYTRRPEQTPILCSLERLSLSQLIQQRTIQTQHLADLFCIRHIIRAEHLESSNRQRIGVAQHNPLELCFSLSNRWRTRSSLFILFYPRRPRLSELRCAGTRDVGGFLLDDILLACGGVKGGYRARDLRYRWER